MEPANRTGQISNRRLDSWKEIAAFFDRDERTVRRWEKERELPVHRVPGKGRGSVYAFTVELAQWLKSPQFADEPGLESTPAQPDSVKGLSDSGSNVVAWDGAERRVLPVEATGPNPYEPSLTFKKYLIAVMMVITAIFVIGVARSPSLQLSSFLPARLSRRFSSPKKTNTPPAETAGKRVPANPEALDLYLKGRYEWSKRSPESLSLAVDDFTQSIVHDPNYAPAYAGLADTYNLLREYTNMPSNEAYPRAIAAAKKAVELDDTLSDAHRSLAFATFYWTWDFAAAEKEFKRAIELNPKDPVAHHWYATALVVIGRMPESLAEIERARELDPSSESILADKAILLFDDKRADEAIKILTQIENADPSFYSPHAYLATIALYKNDYHEYLTESKKAAEIKHDPIAFEINAAAKKGFETGGEAGMLKGIYRIQKQYYDRGSFPGLLLAETCTKLGRKDEALGYLAKSYDVHDPVVLDIRSDNFLNDLREEPAYRELLSRIGLPPNAN